LGGIGRDGERERGRGPEECRDRGREGQRGWQEGRKQRTMNKRKGGSYGSHNISFTPIKKLRTQNLQPGYENHFVNMLHCGVCFSE
jgi:hypothetical protein